jgi:hypothetical protein
VIKVATRLAKPMFRVGMSGGRSESTIHPYASVPEVRRGRRVKHVLAAEPQREESAPATQDSGQRGSDLSSPIGVQRRVGAGPIFTGPPRALAAISDIARAGHRLIYR